MKFVFVLALLCTSAFGQAFQQPPSAKDMFLVPKKSPLSVELYRSGRICGGLRDCDITQMDNAHLGFSPCATDPLSCHLALEKHDYSVAPIGGFKVSGTMGPVTLSLGRHGDNPLLAHSPVLEGGYQFGPSEHAYFGVVRHTDLSGAHHPMLFFLVKKQL